MINCQPSIMIKKMILIGKEIITGGNIIIPKLIKMEATIISILEMVRILEILFQKQFLIHLL